MKDLLFAVHFDDEDHGLAYEGLVMASDTQEAFAKATNSLRKSYFYGYGDVRVSRYRVDGPRTSDDFLECEGVYIQTTAFGDCYKCSAYGVLSAGQCQACALETPVEL